MRRTWQLWMQSNGLILLGHADQQSESNPLKAIALQAHADGWQASSSTLRGLYQDLVLSTSGAIYDRLVGAQAGSGSDMICKSETAT
jgi:hypothetical protein